MLTRSFSLSLSLYFGEKRLVEGEGERGRAGGFEVAPWPVDDVRGYLFVIQLCPVLLTAGQTHSALTVLGLLYAQSEIL
jgi:hypothetical protein